VQAAGRKMDFVLTDLICKVCPGVDAGFRSRFD
jgi:hypothetical protein